MPIKRIEQRVPSLTRIAVTDPVTAAGIGLGQAGERLGNILTDIGFKGLERATIKDATDLANQVVLRDSEGNILPPRLPEANGMLGPTLAEEQYSKQLLDRYRNEVVMDGNEYMNNLHKEYRFKPAEFNSAAAAYINQVSESTPTIWQAQIQEKLNNIRVQHSTAISSARSDRDFKEAQTAHVNLMTLSGNDLSNQLMMVASQNPDDPDSWWTNQSVQKGISSYNELVYEGLNNQFFGGIGGQQLFLGEQEKFAKAIIAGKLQSKGDGYHAQGDRQAILDEFASGKMMLAIPEYQEDGDMHLVQKTSGELFGDRLTGLSRDMRSWENQHQNYLKTVSDLAVDRMTQAFADSLNVQLTKAMNLQAGEYMDMKGINDAFDNLSNQLFELYNEDPVRRDRIISQVVDYAVKKQWSTKRIMRQANAEAAQLANMEELDSHLMIRIERLLNELGVENFAQYTGVNYNDWSNMLPTMDPYQLNDTITNKYNQLMHFAGTSGKGSKKMQQYSAAYMQWWEKASPYIAEFNRQNNLDENTITQAGINHAYKFVPAPEIDPDETGTRFVENILQGVYFQANGQEYDWGDLDQSTLAGRQLLNTYASFGVPPAGVIDHLKSVMATETTSQAQMTRALMWFDELKKNPAHFRSLDTLLGKETYNAYNYLLMSGGNIEDVEIKQDVNNILMRKGYKTYDELSSEDQSGLRKAIDAKLAEPTEWDTEVRPPQYLRPLVRENAARALNDFPNDPEKAVDRGWQDTLDKGGYHTTYTGWDPTARESEREMGEENIYIYAQRPPDWYVQQGTLANEYVHGSSWQQVKTLADLDIDSPLHKDFNTWANKVIHTGPIGERIVLGKNAFLQHLEDDPQTGLPVYRVVVRASTGRYMYARANDPYIMSGGQNEPTFDLNEFYTPWYRNEYNKLQNKGGIQNFLGDGYGMAP